MVIVHRLLREKTFLNTTQLTGKKFYARVYCENFYFFRVIPVTFMVRTTQTLIFNDLRRMLMHIRRLTRRTLLTVFPLLFALVFALVVQIRTASAASLIQLSSDTFTNSSSQHRTEVEPDTFSFGSTLVTAFQTGRIFNGGSSDNGWATSNNNGTTWSNGFLPGTTTFATPPGSFSAISDPSVAYDAAHNTWLILSLGLTNNQTVVVSRSTDNGNTWSNPITILTGSLDKTWIVCDSTATSPFYGHCYAEWDNTASSDLLQMSTSTNGGLTWGSPHSITGN